MTATTSACWHHPRTPAQSGAATPRFARAATQPWAISPAEKKGPMGGLSPSSVKSTRTSRTKSLKIQRVSATSDRLSQRVQQFGFTSYKLDAETGLYAARARMYSTKLGRFVGRDPIGYRDGYGLYSAYFIPNAIDPFGLYSITRLCCCAIEDRIQKNKKTVDALHNMFTNWKPGQGWSNYGFGQLANAAGGRSASYMSAPPCVQEAIDETENRAIGWTNTVQLAVIGASGYYNPINWAIQDSGYAESQFMLTWISIEIFRNKYYGSALEKIRSECQEKYQGCCGETWKAWNCLDQSPKTCPEKYKDDTGGSSSSGGSANA